MFFWDELSYPAIYANTSGNFRDTRALSFVWILPLSLSSRYLMLVCWQNACLLTLKIFVYLILEFGSAIGSDCPKIICAHCRGSKIRNCGKIIDVDEEKKWP